MQVIVYTHPTKGTLSIVVPASDVQSAAKDVPAGVESHTIDHSTLPSDRRWRNAWAHNNGIVSIDVTKAKGMRLAELAIEMKLIRNQIQDALIDNDNVTVVTLRLMLAKYKAAKLSDLPDDLTLLNNWKPV